MDLAAARFCIELACCSAALTMATFVSATVVQGGSGQVLMPWEIIQCNLETQTIKDFCNSNLFPKISSDIQIDQCQVQILILNIDLRRFCWCLEGNTEGSSEP